MNAFYKSLLAAIIEFLVAYREKRRVKRTDPSDPTA
jgi:hypothetical protein